MEISEDDWKVVEARLQADIDAGQGDDLGLAFIGKPDAKVEQDAQGKNNGG